MTHKNWNYKNEEHMPGLYSYSENSSAHHYDNTIKKQDICLIWLHNKYYEANNEDSRRTVEKLRLSVNTIREFTNADRCIDFFMGTDASKVFIIIPDELCTGILNVVHENILLDSVFILPGDVTKYGQIIKKWFKIKGIFTENLRLCEAVQQAAEQHKKVVLPYEAMIQSENDYEEDAIPISFVSVSNCASWQGSDELDPLFMYTQIFKEILLIIHFKESQLQEFITYCRERFSNDALTLNCIEVFKENYTREKAILWYTKDRLCFGMLNYALRIMDVDVIMKMGFFVRDLHRQIEDEHTKQFCVPHSVQPFIVYRGQGLTKKDFDRLKKTQGGLISFNNFLSTSENRAVAAAFAESNKDNPKVPNMMGILFVMTIDPSKSKTPFAQIKQLSFFQDEDEILFSMHTIFRICELKQMDNDNSGRLWEVNLTLTDDDDKDLRALTQRLRRETFQNSDPWQRLGSLLLKIHRPDKAAQVYQLSLKYTCSDHKRVVLTHMLGWAKGDLEENDEALTCCQDSLATMERTLPPNHPDLAAPYNNIGNIYNKRGEHLKAISYYEKALSIQQKNLRRNHSDLAVTHNNIGAACQHMKDYSKALSCYHKALEIEVENLPSYHPNLGIGNYNIGSVHEKMRDYENALMFYEIALGILQRALPPDHPQLTQVKKQITYVMDKSHGY